MRKSAFCGYASGCSLTIAPWTARSSARAASRSAPGREPAEELGHPVHAAVHHRRVDRWCGLVTTLAMISVSAGYGTDGSRTPTMVAERSPSRTVLPITDGSLFERGGPEAMGQHRGAGRLRPVVGRAEQAAEHRTQAHDVEVRPADDAGANHARLAEADHREVDGGEVAEGGQRLDARAKVAGSPAPRSWRSRRRCRARSGGCRSGGPRRG